MTCCLWGISNSTFYALVKVKPSNRAIETADIKSTLQAAYKVSGGNYGESKLHFIPGPWL